MSDAAALDPPPRSNDWLAEWDPEDEVFWETTGRRIATRTLAITTANLVMAFVVWFVVSALITRMKLVPAFGLTPTKAYWLVAMPGLAGGTLRLVHMFLTPIIGTRKVVSISTAMLLIPLVGWYFAIQNGDTPYWMFLLLAFLAGLGGGNFSSFMPSTSLFYPKKKIGTALATQAGIGNFGVSLVQFLTPWLIGFGLIGSTQMAKKVSTDATPTVEWHLQNALLIWIPIVAILAIVAWFGLRSVPVRANMRDQMDIFGERHTYSMTSLYMMTFGLFSGFATAFPLLIADNFGKAATFGGLPNPSPHDALKYAFIGPLVGSIMRIVAGPITDRLGGAKVTQVAGVGLVASIITATFFVQPSSPDEFWPFVLSMVAVFFFTGIGNASTFKQIPGLFDTIKSAGVIGWTAAIAAYGPFLFGVLIPLMGAVPFYIAVAVFCAFNVGLNWWFFARRNAPNPC